MLVRAVQGEGFAELKGGDMRKFSHCWVYSGGSWTTYSI